MEIKKRGKPSFLNSKLQVVQRREKGKNIGARKRNRKSDTFLRNTISLRRIGGRLKKKGRRLDRRDGNRSSLERSHLNKSHRIARLNKKGEFGQKMSLVY